MSRDQNLTELKTLMRKYWARLEEDLDRDHLRHFKARLEQMLALLEVVDPR